MGFVDVVSNGFNKIRAEFERNSCNSFGEFDEDLLMDSYIKCCDALVDRDMQESEYIKYFWKTYSNLYKTSRSNPLAMVRIDDPNNGRIINLQDPYNISIDLTCEKILKMVYKKFSKDHVDAWVLHVYDNKSYDELEELGYNFKFNDIFKRITKWVRKEFDKTKKEIL